MDDETKIILRGTDVKLAIEMYLNARLLKTTYHVTDLEISKDENDEHEFRVTIQVPTPEPAPKHN